MKMIRFLRDNTVAILCILLLCMGAWFTYLLVKPEDVLKDWVVTVDSSKPHYLGEALLVKTSVVKLKDVTGEAHRYLECQNKGAWVKYPLNESNANRPAGSRRSDLLVKIPEDIPQPTRCHVLITVVYHVYSFKTKLESNISNDFDVLKSDKPLAMQPPETVSQDTDNAVLENDPPTGVASQTPMTDPRVESQSTKSEQPPSVLDNLIDSIANTAKRIL